MPVFKTFRLSFIYSVLFLLFFFLSDATYAQIRVDENNSVGIGIDTNTTPNHPTAKLQVDLLTGESKKGFVKPRMDSTDMKGIINPNPIEGLEIYNTSVHEPYFYDGTIWRSMVGIEGPQGPQGNNGVGGVVSAGSGITITGLGTAAAPFVVNAIDTAANNEYNIDFTLIGNILTIIDGGNSLWVDLGTIIPSQSSDDQMLSIDLINKKLVLEDGGSVDLVDLGDNLGNHRATKDLSMNLHDIDSVGRMVMHYGATNDNRNIVIGKNAANPNMTGTNNILLGYYAGADISDDHENIIIGTSAGESSVGNYNIILGQESGVDQDGTNNVLLGSHSGESSNGDYNLLLGNAAGQNNIGSRNVLIGKQAGHANNKSDVLYIENTNSSDPLIFGDFANDTLDINGTLKIQNVNDTINDYVLTYNPTTDEVSKISKSDLKDSNGDNLGNHIATKDLNMDKNGINAVGRIIGDYGTSSNNNNLVLGDGAGNTNMTGTNNILMGYYSAYGLTNGGSNIFLGRYSGLSNTSGSSNISLGSSSGYHNKSGIFNTYIGAESGSIDTAANYNIFIGALSGKSSSGSSNTFLGSQSGILLNGDKNICIGENSGSGSSTTGSIYIGSESGKDINKDSVLYIGNLNNPIIYGDMANDTLDINGTLKIQNVNDSINDYVLTYNPTTDEVSKISKSDLKDSNGDNLGNHIATKDLNMDKNGINAVGRIIGDFGTSSNNNNLVFGYAAGNTNMSGAQNLLMGTFNGLHLTSGKHNIFLGPFTGINNTSGNENIFLGYNSGIYNKSGKSNIYIGQNSGSSDTAAQYNTFIGDLSGKTSSGSFNTFHGHNSGSGLNGDWNIIMGIRAGQGSSTNNSIFIGSESGKNINKDSVLCIGYGNLDNPIIYGDLANDTLDINGTLKIQNVNDSINDYVLTYNPTTDEVSKISKSDLRDTNGDNLGNHIATQNLNMSLNGIDSVGRIVPIIGFLNKNNIFIGENSGNDNTWGSANIFLGRNSGMSAILANTSNNTFIGLSAGQNLTNGKQNVLIGNYAGNALTASSSNTIIGASAGEASSGENNTILGMEAYLDGNGDNNVILGAGAGEDAQCSNSILIGNFAGGSNQKDNRLMIDNSDTDNPLIDGDFANDTLDINGTLKIQNVNDSINDYVLTYNPTTDEVSKIVKDSLLSQVDGSETIINTAPLSEINIIGSGTSENPYLLDLSDNIWKIGGNNLTTYKSLGTIEAVDLNFITHNKERLTIDTIGRIIPDFNQKQSIVIGKWCGNENDVGLHNIVLGNRSAQNATLGSKNIIMGYQVADSLSSDGNIIIGKNSANSIKSNGDNIILGNQNCINSEMFHSIVIGHNSGSGLDNTTLQNIAIGFNSGNNVAGNRNIAIGVTAFPNNGNMNIDDNIAIGRNAFKRSDNNSNDISNSVAIGQYTIIDTSNNIRLGNGDITSIGGFTPWSSYSDARLKKNINESVPGLSFIQLLRPVSYNFDPVAYHNLVNTDESLRNYAAEATKSQIVQSGFLAQEVVAAANSVNYNFSGIDKPKGATGIYGLRYAEFVVPLVKAVQEQQVIIDELTADNQKLENLLQALTLRVEALEK